MFCYFCTSVRAQFSKVHGQITHSSTLEAYNTCLQRRKIRYSVDSLTQRGELKVQHHHLSWVVFWFRKHKLHLEYDQGTHCSEQPLHQQNRHPAVPWLATTWTGFLTFSPNIHLRTTAAGTEIALTLTNHTWKGGRQKLSGVSFQHLNPVFLLQVIWLLQEMGIKDK